MGKDAQVQGTLDGRAAAFGPFNGEVTAKRRVVVYSTGMLEGQVTTPNLLTEEGGIIEEQISMKARPSPRLKHGHRRVCPGRRQCPAGLCRPHLPDAEK